MNYLELKILVYFNFLFRNLRFQVKNQVIMVFLTCMIIGYKTTIFDISNKIKKYKTKEKLSEGKRSLMPHQHGQRYIWSSPFLSLPYSITTPAVDLLLLLIVVFDPLSFYTWPSLQLIVAFCLNHCTLTDTIHHYQHCFLCYFNFCWLKVLVSPPPLPLCC